MEWNWPVDEHNTEYSAYFGNTWQLPIPPQIGLESVLRCVLSPSLSFL